MTWKSAKGAFPPQGGTLSCNGTTQATSRTLRKRDFREGFQLARPLPSVSSWDLANWICPLNSQSSGSTAGFHSGSIIAIALQIAVQAGASNPQDLSGLQSVSLVHFQDSLDVRFTHFVERQRLPILALPRVGIAMLEKLRQITQVDEVARSGDARAGNDVLQFAHIAWPCMLQQNGLRAPR